LERGNGRWEIVERKMERRNGRSEIGERKIERRNGRSERGIREENAWKMGEGTRKRGNVRAEMERRRQTGESGEKVGIRCKLLINKYRRETKKERENGRGKWELGKDKGEKGKEGDR
jgi:hypothetical protein